MKWKIYISVICVLLFVIVLLFLVKDLYLYIIAKKFQTALSNAENNDVFCVDNNPVCELAVNDTLGVPSPTQDLKVFSTENARILADLVTRVELAAKNNTTITSPPGFAFVEAIYPNSGPVFVGVWTVDTTMFFAFRGTITSAEWQKDLSTQQDSISIGNLFETHDHSHEFKMKEGEEKGCKQTNWAGHARVPDADKILVHNGFLQMFNEFKQEMTRLIDLKKPDRIYFTGHSLGAAVSTLAGLQFFDMAPGGIVVYTFASPRVGNIMFSKTVQLTFPLFRISNQSDLINDIPLAVMINLSGNQLPYIYNHTGENHSFNISWGGWKNNHLLPIYTNCLGDSSCLVTTVPFSI
jgi:hypothetical protein